MISRTVHQHTGTSKIGGVMACPNSAIQGISRPRPKLVVRHSPFHGPSRKCRFLIKLYRELRTQRLGIAIKPTFPAGTMKGTISSNHRIPQSSCDPICAILPTIRALPDPGYIPISLLYMKLWSYPS